MKIILYIIYVILKERMKGDSCSCSCSCSCSHSVIDGGREGRAEKGDERKATGEAMQCEVILTTFISKWKDRERK